MEVLLAVIVGALLWLVGPARGMWTPAKSKQRRSRSDIRADLSMNAAADMTRHRPSSLPMPPQPGVAPVPPRARIPSSLASPAAPSGVSVEPELSRPRAPAHAEPLLQMPITLGVALLLQAAAFTLLCGLGALGYISLDLKARADAQTLERNLTHEIVVLEESLAATRRTLESMQRMLAAQQAPARQAQTAVSAQH